MYEMVERNGEFWAAQYPSSVVGRRGLSHGNIATHHRQYSPIYNGSVKSYGQIVGTENSYYSKKSAICNATTGLSPI